jgi:hypothetical protein
MKVVKRAVSIARRRDKKALFGTESLLVEKCGGGFGGEFREHPLRGAEYSAGMAGGARVLGAYRIRTGEGLANEKQKAEMRVRKTA